jgi:DNA-directed RNA polymerase omega subunit
MNYELYLMVSMQPGIVLRKNNHFMVNKKEETVDETEETQAEEAINPPEIDSKYRMIILAAQRSKQLQRGAIPRVDADIRKTKPTRIAMREFSEKKVNFTFDD